MNIEFYINNEKMGFTGYSSIGGEEPNLDFFKEALPYLKGECFISFNIGGQRVENKIIFDKSKFYVKNNFIPYDIEEFVDFQKKRVQKEKKLANFEDKLIDIYYIPSTLLLSYEESIGTFDRTKLVKDPKGEKFFVSHPWLSDEHPDPNGKHLALLQKHAREQKREVFYWFDYSCLPQHPRTIEDEKLFQETLPKISSIQSKGSTIIIVDKNYHERMWCYIEHYGAVIFSQRNHTGVNSNIEYIGDDASNIKMLSRVQNLEAPPWNNLKVSDPSDIKSIKDNYTWLSNLTNFQLFDRCIELLKILPGYKVLPGFFYHQSAFGLNHELSTDKIRPLFYEFGGDIRYFFTENSLIWLAERMSWSIVPENYDIENLQFSQYILHSKDMVGWIALILAIIKTLNKKNNKIINFRELYVQIILISLFQSKKLWIGNIPKVLSEELLFGMSIYFKCNKCNYQSKKLDIGMTTDEETQKHPLIPCVCTHCREFRLHPVEEVTWENNPKYAWANKVGAGYIYCQYCQKKLSVFEMFKIFVFITSPKELKKKKDRDNYLKGLSELKNMKYKCVKCNCNEMKFIHSGYHS